MIDFRLLLSELVLDMGACAVSGIVDENGYPHTIGVAGKTCAWVRTALSALSCFSVVFVAHRQLLVLYPLLTPLYFQNFLEFLMKPPPPPRRDDAECSAKLASRQKQEADASDAMTQGLEKLYGDHSGNLEAIFDVLGEDPGKALKYPPKDAKGFATKYLAGGYTYVEVRKAPSKPKTAAALSNSGGGGGVDAMTQGFADLYTQHGGNLEAIFEVLGENPNKALKYPPSDAIDFATKYIAGNFTYAAGKAGRTGASGGSGSFDGKPGSPNGGKSSGGAAGGGSSDADPMVAALENLYGQHGGDLEAIFAQLGENPKKALK